MDIFDKTNIEKISFEDVQKFKEAFFSSKDTVFIIVADESPQKIKDLTKKWLASIPTTVSYDLDRESQLYAIDNDPVEIITRNDNKDISYVTNTIYKKNINVTQRDDLIARIAQDYVDYLLNTRIREELGDSYFVSTTVAVNFMPVPSKEFEMLAPSTRKEAENTLAEIKDALSTITPVNPEIFNKSKNIIISDAEEHYNNLNSSAEDTSSDLIHYVAGGRKLYADPNELFSELDSITEEEVNTFINELLKENSFSIITVPNPLAQ